MGPRLLEICPVDDRFTPASQRSDGDPRGLVKYHSLVPVEVEEDGCFRCQRTSWRSDMLRFATRLQKSQSVIRDAITATAFRKVRVARWHDPTTSRDISRQAGVVVFPDDAAAPELSGANSRCRRRYLRGCAIVFHRAISTSLQSRCQLRMIPKRSGLSYRLSPVLNRAAPRQAAFASRLYTHTHTYIGCVAGLVDGLKCVLQRRWRGLFQNGSRVCSFSSRQKTKVKGIRANLHVPVPFYPPVGRRTDCSCSPGIGQGRRGYR
jgi:hypothetical protein